MSSVVLLKDLIDIPERVHRGDFVLKLTEGLATAESRRATLASYVVTPQLQRCFDDALAFIESGVGGKTSKAAYLHGSFGSGKSHFMAVLHLLLEHDPDARAVPELAEVVARHDGWLQGRRLLLVPCHMIGASTMEAAVLGQYADYVKKLHPEAPTPGVFLAEGLFADAVKLRARMGDESFFAGLNAGAGAAAKPGWGGLGTRGEWDAARFEEALEAPVGDERRAKLVGALVERYFESYRRVASSSASVGEGRVVNEGFVDLDTGLAVLDAHARDLGYDALVLFLDELILWLASRVGDVDFVSREGQKISKLVESRIGERPIPLISFVARQRDLRELVGDSVPGAEKLSFADTLKWWEGRFHKITLEDRNLPAIAEKRLLAPRDGAARQRIDEAFKSTLGSRREVIETLLTEDGDRALFRRVYPFSPALVKVLVALSQVLQRERTAIRVMLQLLVEQRDRLELGQLIPLGDLWDVIAEEAEPFTDDMRRHFDNAQRLYDQKLLPMLERNHGLEPGERPAADDPRRQALAADARLLKTLLLAALVPDEPSLKGMTADRLEALNHGTIRAPIAGREKHEVTRKCRQWSSAVGEVKIGEGPGPPAITIQLSSVDTEGIVERAKVVDNQGERRKKIRETVYRLLGEGVDEKTLYEQHYRFLWRGSARRVELAFGNVREMTYETLEGAAASGKVVIDFPFDEAGHGPKDDYARLQEYRSERGSTRTVAWLPRFFSQAVLNDLGTLVVLDHVLASDDRFRLYSEHLSAVDRAAARNLLDNQRSSLRQHLENCLLGAFGVAPAPGGALDATLQETEPFHSLDDGFQPRPPVGADLRQALENLLDQWLAHRFPAHPRFDVERVEKRDLKKVHAEVQRAIDTADGRLAVDKALRPLMAAVAAPLELGEMHETHFLLGTHWRRHFDPVVQAAEARPTVRALRERLDEPAPMGLERPAANLVILTWAEQTNRVFRLGGPIDPTLDDLPDEAVVEEQPLPADEVWQAARERSEKLFGLAASPLKNAANVARWCAGLRAEVEAARPSARRLASELRRGVEALGAEGGDRLRTAQRAAALVDELARAPDERLADVLASAALDNPAAAGRSLGSAATVAEALCRAKWQLLKTAFALADERADEARKLSEGLLDVLGRDQFSAPLEGVLEEVETAAAELLAKVVPPPVEKKPPVAGKEPPDPTPPPATQKRTVRDTAGLKRLFEELKVELGRGPLTVRWRFGEDGEP